MLKALIKSRLSAFAHSFFRSKGSAASKGKGKGTAVLMAILFIYLAVVFLGLFASVFDTFAQVLIPMDLSWLYFSMAALLCFCLMFIFSLFSVKAQLYEAKDNELLLAMPIPPKYILASRMASLLIINAVYGALAAVPAGVIWCIKGRVTPFGVFAFVCIFLALPFFSLAVSAAFAWVLEKITRRMSNKNFLTLIFSLLFLGAYMFYYSKAMNALSQFFLYAESLSIGIRKILPLYWIGNAVANGNILHFLISFLILVLPFLLVYIFLQKSFIDIATFKASVKVKKYKGEAQKHLSPSSALLRREFRRFGSSSVYMMNAGLGLVFMPLLAGYAFFRKETFASLEILAGESLPLFGALILSFVLSLCNMTASAISIEGKELWILRSLPIPTRDILKAKIRMQLYLTLPVSLISAAVLSLALSASITETVLILLFTAAYAFFCGYLGLWMNLKHPSLDWLNETAAVKQGLSVLFTMLITMAVSTVSVIAAIALMNKLSCVLLLGLMFALFAAASTLLRQLIMSRGVKIFEKL